MDRRFDFDRCLSRSAMVRINDRHLLLDKWTSLHFNIHMIDAVFSPQIVSKVAEIQGFAYKQQVTAIPLKTYRQIKSINNSSQRHSYDVQEYRL